MTSEEYGQYIDDFELGADVMPGESLTEYIKRRQQEFESKADGGSIGIEVLFKEKMKDGGRVGLFMGGPPLKGIALNIYESMNAYGFSDQEIADTLKARGLYDVTPAVETPVTNTATNIINRGGEGKDDRPDVRTDPYAGLGFSSANFGLGQGINKDAVMDYEADAYEIGRTPLGQLSKFRVGIVESLKNIPTPINLFRKAMEFTKQKELEKKAQEEAIARDLARELQQQNIANQTGGYQFGYDKDSDFMGGGDRGTGLGPADRGGSDTMGSFKRGGLATMFTRRR